MMRNTSTNSSQGLTGNRGFTLIELVMVMIIVAILAAVALPNFFDFRTDARNAATYGALAGLRSAVSIGRAAIALKEATTAPSYPTLAEMQGNAYLLASHPVLSALTPNNIMDASAGIPVNPWTASTIPTAQWNTVWDCSTLSKGFVLSAAGSQNVGWCYNTSNGQLWANSALNGGAAGATENTY